MICEFAPHRFLSGSARGWGCNAPAYSPLPLYSGKIALPVPRSGQAGQDRGLPAALGSRYCRGASLLRESFGDKSDAVAAQGDLGRSCTESLRATAVAAGEPKVMEVRRGAQLQIFEQYRRAGPPSHQAALRIDDGVQVFRQCIDHDLRHRTSSSHSQEPVLLRTRSP